ncbi:MAG TPA: GNAT family N-acetyltransferase [Clostridia bacterium]|nr:GNAT family N-acetyltransferase [Clostridia bacterium]
MNGCDMIANLTTLPENKIPEGIALKRAISCDKSRILAFIRLHFGRQWADETEYALNREPQGCFIATENGKVLGFACYDATAKGFFGPTGVALSQRGRGIGRALLIRTLEGMREAGYGYAIIGSVDDAEGFYKKTLGASYIPGGEPEHSVYTRLIKM